MKLTTRVSRLLFVTACVMSPLYAQDIDNLNKEVKELEKQLTELKGDALNAKEKLSDEEYQERQKRLAENIASAAVETAKNVAKGAKNKKFLKVLELQKRHANYLKDLSEGKVRPFTNIVEKYPQYQDQLVEMSTQYQAYLTETDPVKRAAIAGPLLKLIQPFGSLLRDASHPADLEARKVSDEEVAELNRIKSAYESMALPDIEQGKLKLLTPDAFFTLLHLPMPIEFSAPAGTEVLLFSSSGGNFENNQPYISIVANENDVASTYWISEGDGVAEALITYRSLEHPITGSLIPTVKQLAMIPLEDLSPQIKTASNKAIDKIKQSVK